MSTPTHPPSYSPALALAVRIILWIIWAGLLIGALSFASVLTLILASPPSGGPTHPDAITPLLYVDFIGGPLAISAVFIIRYFLFRKLFQRPPSNAHLLAYGFGKIVFWAVCDGVMFFNFIICMIAHTFLPTFPIAIAVWTLILLDAPLFRPFKSPSLPIAH